MSFPLATAEMAWDNKPNSLYTKNSFFVHKSLWFNLQLPDLANKYTGCLDIFEPWKIRNIFEYEYISCSIWYILIILKVIRCLPDILEHTLSWKEIRQLSGVEKWKTSQFVNEKMYMKTIYKFIKCNTGGSEWVLAEKREGRIRIIGYFSQVETTTLYNIR